MKLLSEEGLRNEIIARLKETHRGKEGAEFMETIGDVSLVCMLFATAEGPVNESDEPQTGIFGATLWLDPRIEVGQTPLEMRKAGGITGLAGYILVKQAQQISGACIDMGMDMAAKADEIMKEAN